MTPCCNPFAVCQKSPTEVSDFGLNHGLPGNRKSIASLRPEGAPRKLAVESWWAKGAALEKYERAVRLSQFMMEEDKRDTTTGFD